MEHVATSVEDEKRKNVQLPDLVKLQRTCLEFEDIHKYKLLHAVPDDPEKAKTVVAEAYNFELDKGILVHLYLKGGKNTPQEHRLVKQVVIHRVLRYDVHRFCHDCILAGHQGFKRTYAVLLLGFNVPGYPAVCSNL